MAYRWFKVYVEILDDPKMGRLPDRLWRRTIELFAFARKWSDDGSLPPVPDMAWTLHLDEGELTADLEALAALPRPIISRNGDGWRVTNFVTRQAPEPNEVRQAAKRERDRTVSPPVTTRDNPVTVALLDLDIDSDSDLDSDSDVDQTETRPDETQKSAPAPLPSPAIVAESAPKKPRPAPKPAKDPPPEAIRAFHDASARYPNKVLWDGIVQVVGADPPDLERWQRVVRAWIACGWNPGNVKGMLSHFRDKTLPGDDYQKRGGNGKAQPAEPKSYGVLRELAREQGWDQEDGTHVFST
jgi:hypothetical protein